MLAAEEARRVGASARSGQAGSAGAGGRPIAGASGELPDRSPAVTALLKSHRVGTQAARSTARVGEGLRQRMGETDIEFAALIDDITGYQVGGILSGTVDRLNLLPHLDALRPGGHYVHVHTHPASSSLSDYDLAILLAHVEIRTMAVVGRDGTWYILSRVRGQPAIDPGEGRALWKARFVEIATPHNALIARGALREADALRLEVHQTMTRLAPEIGLRYDHLEPLR